MAERFIYAVTIIEFKQTNININLFVRAEEVKEMEKFSDIVISEEIINKKKIFVAESLELDIASQGNSIEEALKNVKEAIKLHLEESS